jgi:hypothetical protein
MALIRMTRQSVAVDPRGVILLVSGGSLKQLLAFG